MTRIDITDMVVALDDIPEPSRGVFLVVEEAGESESAVDAVRSALEHDASVRTIARNANVDVEELLHYLGAATRRLMMASLGNAFSDSEWSAIVEAGIDLSGPREGYPDPELAAIASMAIYASSALSVAEVAAKIGVSPGRVRQRIAAGSLYAFRVSGAWRVPQWQFNGDGLLPGLDVVVPRIPRDLHALSLARLMHEPNADLDVAGAQTSPVDWLASAGDPMTVADLIEGVSIGP